VIAVCAALILSVGAGESGHRAPPGAAALDNAARAKRGLLPRKATKAPPAARARRIVVVPSAPTFLGEPEAAPAASIVAVSADDPADGLRRPRPMVAAEASGVEVDVTLVLRWEPSAP
jgi:hypothetical protein